MAESSYVPLQDFTQAPPPVENPTPYPLSSEEEALVQRKCKRCGQYFTKAENTGPCFYHPGHWREPSPHAGALVGWSCCAVAGFVDEYNLLSIMNQNAMNKDSKGCTEAQQHEEDPDYTRATSVFPFHPEDLSMGGLAGLKNRKTGETAGAAQTKTPTPDQTIGTNFVKHTIQRTDTLAGLALKYNTTVEAIKRANNMFTHSMTHLDHVLIPLKPGAKPPTIKTNSKHDAIVQFIRTCKCTQEEAKYYLESTEYDVEKAIADFNSDVRWERNRVTPQ